jgi:hypothetical protein
MPSSPEVSNDPVAAYLRARAVSETFKAKMAQLEYEERAAKLIQATKAGEYAAHWSAIVGSAPDWEKIYLRREDYDLGIVPAKGSLLVTGDCRSSAAPTTSSVCPARQSRSARPGTPAIPKSSSNRCLSNCCHPRFKTTAVSPVM